MRVLLVAIALSCILLVAGAAVSNIVLFAIPVLAGLVAGLVVVFVFRKPPGRAAFIAVAFDLAPVLALGGVAVVNAQGSDADCDGFCMTRTEQRIFIMFGALVWGLVTSAATFVLVWLFTANATHAPSAH